MRYASFVICQLLFVICQLSWAATPTYTFRASSGGTPAVTDITGLGTGVATALAAAINTTGGCTTINGTATLTNKTLTSPTLTTPVLGTPSSGNLGSCTAYPGDSALVTTGTITSGTWSATAIAVTKGGTGLATLTANNVMLGAGTSTPTFVAPGTNGNVLTSNGTTWTSAAAAGGSVDQSASYTWTGTHIFDGPTTYINNGGTSAIFKGVDNSGQAAWLFSPANHYLKFQQTYTLSWSSSGAAFNTQDVGLRRNGAGILEIYDGETAGTGCAIRLNNMTAPSAVTGGGHIFANSSEIKVLDGAGNSTTISPHAKDAPASLYDNAPGGDYVYRSSNDYAGKVNFINLDRLAAKVDALTRGQPPCRVVETYAEYNKRTGEKLKVREWDQKGPKPEFLKK